jgi:hypothetical protein
MQTADAISEYNLKNQFSVVTCPLLHGRVHRRMPSERVYQRLLLGEGGGAELNFSKCFLI